MTNKTQDIYSVPKVSIYEHILLGNIHICIFFEKNRTIFRFIYVDDFVRFKITLFSEMAQRIDSNLFEKSGNRAFFKEKKNSSVDVVKKTN